MFKFHVRLEEEVFFGGNERAARHSPGEAPQVNETKEAGAWRAPTTSDLTIDNRRLWVEVPLGFTEIQRDAPGLALEWRMHTRDIFETYFARSYRAVDFELQRDEGRGRYLLAVQDAQESPAT